MVRPLIGITSNYEPSTEYPGKKDACKQPAQYFQALEGAGALPVILPAAQDPETLEGYLAELDGILFSGADDLPPECYGAAPHPKTRPMSRQRFKFEWALVRRALAHRSIPLLGVCGGCQLFSAVAGGTLIQDIPELVPGAVPHRCDTPAVDAVHPADFTEGTVLAEIFGARAEINSAHHQAIDRVGEGFVVIARAQDGVIEAIQRPGARFVLGVQWHPERCLDLPGQKELVARFVHECELFTCARAVGAAD